MGGGAGAASGIFRMDDEAGQQGCPYDSQASSGRQAPLEPGE